MATLTRIAELPDSLTPLDEDLAKEARNLFGYQPGIAAVQQTTQQRRLIQELLALGVRPFSEASVARYKAAQIRNRWLRMLAWMAVATALVAGGGYLFARNPSFVAGAMVATGVIGFFAAMFIYQPLNWNWRRVGIRNYALPIPAHVLATAVQIHTALASKLSIALSVDVFRVDETVYDDPDPFLVVTNELGAVAYVEVWDEPSFTAVRKDA